MALACGVGGVVGDLDAAGLAAATDLDLGLDDDAAAELLGDPRVLPPGCAHLAGEHGYAVLGEEIPRLVLEQVHEKGTLSADAV